MKTLFNIENGFKALVIILLSTIAFGSKAADFGGTVGVSSDNYFRGVNMSDGVGYTLRGSVDLGNGIFAGAKVMSMDESSDLMTTTMIGYGKEVGGVLVNVAYLDRNFDGGVDFEEVAVRAYFDNFDLQYSVGLDDAGDTIIVSSDALPYVNVAYGDSDISGSWYEVSKSLDLAKGKLKVGYIDHESNDDDLGDKITDVDNFYVGYSYSF
tara:strand:+ start:606 stop:1235 length:630 start_codon:yes stop_codon:yes gene_type:complete